jgi:translation elongation factor EF-Tu-like GTPase
MEFLSKVESTFSISGRGLVIVPEKPESDFLIRVGTELELRTPDGRSLKTHITGVELLKPLPGQGPCRLAFPITRDIGKDDVPVGTEIWYLRVDAT